MNPPPLGKSIAMGVRAAAGEGWLIAVAALLAVVRTLAPVPALVVAGALAVKGAGTAARLRPFSLTAPFEGAVAVVTSPRYLAIVGGLLLVGTVLAGLLRVLFLAGALPTLAARAAGIDAARRFAPGVLWGSPRQLATWLLAALVDLAATGYLLAVGIAIVRVGASATLGVHPALLAGAGAAALGIAVVGLLVARILGDAAAARAAVLDEGPGRAYAGAVRRFLGRPGGFALAGLAAAFAALAMSSALQPLAGGVALLSGQLDGAVVLGPRLMLALLGVLGAAAVDLAWLATVSVLACGAAAEPASPVGGSVSA